MTEKNAMKIGGIRTLEDLEEDTPDPFILALGLRKIAHHFHRLKRIGPDKWTGQATKEAIAARDSLKGILAGAGVSADKAEDLSKRALEAAFTYRSKVFLQDQRSVWHKRKNRAAFYLQRKLRAAADCIDELPPGAKGKLNQVLKEVDWKTFDTEAFVFIVENTLAVLDVTSPKCKADEVRLALVEDDRLPEKLKRELPDIARTAPLWVIELWEASPACRQLEAKIRGGMRGPQSRELAPFFRYLADRVSYQELVRADPPSVAGYIQSVRSIAKEVGIRYWPGYNYFSGQHVESDFQAFAGNALAAVGDERPISTRQLKNAAKSSRSI